MDDLLKNAPCGFLALTDNGEIVEINNTLLNLLGYRQEDLKNVNVKKLFSAPGNIFYQTHFFPLLKLQGKLEEIYLSFRSVSGEEIPVLVNAARREHEGSIFYDFVLLPMRQRNRYEEELLKAKKEAETANRTKEEFLSVVSHDLRTPLGAILGWTEILKNKAGDEKLVRKAVEVIKRSATAQKVLIEDILDLARITSGKLHLETDSVDLTGIIENAIEMIAPAAREKEIEIRSDLPKNVVITGDGARLQQVLWNLLSNAIKFTPKNGQVNIELSEKGANVEIRISDTGKGISAEFLPYIFDRFQQEENTKTPQYSGLGLGLAISRHIVDLHGGTIHAESPGQNGGAVFTVVLPVAPS